MGYTSDVLPASAQEFFPRFVECGGIHLECIQVVANAVVKFFGQTVAFFLELFQVGTCGIAFRIALQSFEFTLLCFCFSFLPFDTEFLFLDKVE